MKVTVSLRGSPRSVDTVKPPAGTAETRQTPSPNRRDARPPVVRYVRTWAPAARQPSPSPASVAVADGVGAGEGRAAGEAGAFGGGGGGDGRRVAGGMDAGDLLGSGLATGDETTVPGVSRATGGVGRVVPTTNWTVRFTAVTLRDVHDSHSST
ncbi:hypothetical protein [Streptomyces glaucosporus]|uniref:hypothetical protein n=1 Tax=Streptomyces glaucosporus TaxID=284044 RepID=UPI0031E05C23